MSREIDRLRDFFDWLLTPRNVPRPDSQWKQQQIRKLSKLGERVRKNRVMAPSKELDNAIASLRTEQEKLRHGFVYVVPKPDRNSRGPKSLRFLTTGKLRGEAERRFLAVLIARYLYPEQSTYEKLRKDLKKRGLHCQTGTLRQRFHRFLKGLKGDRTQAVFKIAFAHYGQFRSEGLATAKRMPKQLVLSASEGDLLCRIAEGWRLTFRKNKHTPEQTEVF